MFIGEETELYNLITTCSSNTLSKGFKPQEQLSAQCMLIASECAEAMEVITKPEGDAVLSFMHEHFLNMMQLLESYRKKNGIQDDSSVEDMPHFLEELSDVCIRVFSLVGAMDKGVEFVNAMLDKIEVNKERPVLHGKAF